MTSTTIRIKKGLDITLAGEAVKECITIFPKTCASKPIDFTGVFPKVLVKEGDPVEAGTPLYYDKYREQILFTAPVSGTVQEIRRGEKRLLTEIILKTDDQIRYVDFGKADPRTLSREQIVEKLLKSGIWPVIRQRPYSIIAHPAGTPKAIVIPAFDTSPLAPDYSFILKDQADAFQAGLDALSKLTTGPLYLNVLDSHDISPVFLEARGVKITRFAGPHPAGNVSTQISRLDPINKGDIIWYLRPQEVLMIGRLFLSGVYDATKIFALTGPAVKKPAYYKSITGTSVEAMTEGNLVSGHTRCISGNVLTGRKIEHTGYAGFYDSQITVIPEGDYYSFLGWAVPGWKKFSFYRQFLSRLFPPKQYEMDTNLHGGERAFVITGKYEQVFPFDIYPMQLIKAILTEDIDLMENLGIYEVDTEDFALIEFIDTSKTEIQQIISSGLDLLRKETS